MKHNNRKKNRTHRSFDVMRLLFDLWGLDKKISPGTHLNSTLSLFYKEPSKNKEWFFFSKREILWRMERVQRMRSGSLFTQTETIKMWRWQLLVNQNDLWSTIWAIWKSFKKVLTMTNQWRWLWISAVKASTDCRPQMNTENVRPCENSITFTIIFGRGRVQNKF